MPLSTPTTPPIEQLLWSLTNQRCYYCWQITLPRLRHIDHIRPLALISRGQATRDEIINHANYAPACDKCNGAKKDRTIEEYRLIAPKEDLTLEGLFRGEIFRPLPLLKPAQQRRAEASREYPPIPILTIAATGHRPEKLGGYIPFYKESPRGQTAFHAIRALRPDFIISGMAVGWDQDIAEAGVRAGIKVIAAIPFKGQENLWPRGNQLEYYMLLDKCHEQHVICDGDFSPEKYQIRNRWMVDHANQIAALWNGSTGGTLNCLGYAQRKRVPIVNFWSFYQSKAKL